MESSQWDRTSQVFERRRELGSNKGQRLHSRRNETVERAGERTSGKLVKQAASVLSIEVGGDGSILDGAKVDGIERAIRSIAAKQDGLEEIHLQDLK